jgi:hypothetical protein
MAMCRIAGDEDATLPVSVCCSDPQLPETDVLEFKVELRPDCGMKILPKVEIVLSRPEGRWCVNRSEMSCQVRGKV